MRLYHFKFILFIILFTVGCETREMINPFDMNCSKEIFTPSNLIVTLEEYVIKLSWEQENKDISGFIIRRNENGSEMTEVKRLASSDSVWYDKNIVGGRIYAYQLYAYADLNLSNPLEGNFTPLFSPSVTTSYVKEVTHKSALFTGIVTDEGGAPVTERGFCYGLNQYPTISNKTINAGNGPGEFSKQAWDLFPDTRYFVRAYGINSKDTAYGNQAIFKTLPFLPPEVETGKATGHSSTSVTLYGTVNANGRWTNVSFEFGTSPSYGSTVVAEQSPVSGTGNRMVSAMVQGLLTETIYHYRISAQSDAGTTFGADRHFKTVSLPPSIPYEGLILYYPFTGNAMDESGNGNDATVMGPTLTVDRHGNINSAYRFDGQDDYVEADASDLPTAERTVSLWFYARTVENRPGLLGYGGSSTPGTSWFMGINCGGEQSFHNSGHYKVNNFNYYYNQPPVEKWYHWVITTSQNGSKMYIDGIEVASNARFVNNTYVLNKELGIGVIAGATGIVPYTDSNVKYFNGDIDDILIYERALSQEEILLIYHEDGWE